MPTRDRDRVLTCAIFGCREVDTIGATTVASRRKGDGAPDAGGTGAAVARAVRARMTELGVGPTELGVSDATIRHLLEPPHRVPVRAPYRRALAESLKWPPNALDLIEQGIDFATFHLIPVAGDTGERLGQVADAIEALRKIQAEQTTLLRALVEELREQRNLPPGPSPTVRGRTPGPHR